MAGLAGLIGAGQVFAGRSFASALSTSWQDAIGVCLTVALLLAAGSSVLAGLAAYGRPGTFRLAGTAKAGGQAEFLRDETKRLLAEAHARLVQAAVLAGFAFAVAVFVAAALWWAPQSPPAICIRGPNGTVTHVSQLPTVTSGSLVVVGCGT